jgi:undecaprenyl-diphosphatase
VGGLTIRGRGCDLDRRLFRVLNRDRGPAVDRVFGFVTELGSIWAAAGAAAVLSMRGRRREGLDALGAAATMWLIGQGAKRLFARPRPYDALEDARRLIGRPSGTSWPSSHPAVLLSFVTVAGRNLDVPSEARSALAGLAGTVGLSRVVLGVHFPADVVGGLLLGRGVADLWSAVVSPRVVGDGPKASLPATVGP